MLPSVGHANPRSWTRTPGAGQWVWFLNGLCSLTGRESSESEVQGQTLGAERKASLQFSLQEAGAESSLGAASYLRKVLSPWGLLYNGWEGRESLAVRVAGVKLRKKAQRNEFMYSRHAASLANNGGGTGLPVLGFWPLWSMLSSKQSCSR